MPRDNEEFESSTERCHHNIEGGMIDTMKDLDVKDPL